MHFNGRLIKKRWWYNENRKVSYFGMAIVVRWFSRSFWPRMKADLLTAMLCSVLYLLTGIWYWNGNGFQPASFWPASPSSSSAHTVDVLPSDHTTSTLGCCCWEDASELNVSIEVPLMHLPWSSSERLWCHEGAVDTMPKTMSIFHTVFVLAQKMIYFTM